MKGRNVSSEIIGFTWFQSFIRFYLRALQNIKKQNIGENTLEEAIKMH